MHKVPGPLCSNFTMQSMQIGFTNVTSGAGYFVTVTDYPYPSVIFTLLNYLLP